jgi:hypothetical protein
MRLLAVLVLAAACGGSGQSFARVESVRYCEVYIDAGAGQYYYVPGFTITGGYDSTDTLVYRRFEDEWEFAVTDDGLGGPMDIMFDEWMAQGGDPLRAICQPVPVEEFEEFLVFLYDFSIGGYVRPADYRRFLRDHPGAEYEERP